jgi:hypothetical protein
MPLLERVGAEDLREIGDTVAWICWKNPILERTRLALVTSKSLPFPPEPVRSAVVQLTRSSLGRADRNEGRRDAWLRLLDRLGLGSDL